MIELKNITRNYESGGVVALDDIDLRIGRGEFITVVGPSGSGKSTLLHILGALDRPDSGSYSLEGHDITHLADRDLSRIRNIHFGFVFQSFHLLPHHTCLENVAKPLVYAGVARKERIRQAAEMLDRLGMGHRLRHFPSMLSGGEQQRVAIARSIINNPSLVLADEPTGNLPSELREEVMTILRSLHDAGTTLVLVTHDEVVAAAGLRCLRIGDGQIVSDSALCTHQRRS